VIAVLKHVGNGHVSSHARGACKSVFSILHGGKVALKVEASGVTAASIVKDNGFSRGGLGVSGGHSDGR